MKKILIYATDSICTAIVANVTALMAVAGNIPDEDFSLDVSEVRAQPKIGKARVKYRGIFPAGWNVDQIRDLIVHNSKEFGEVTMKAVIYRDLAEATLTGHLLTKKEIAENRSFTASTVEREIGSLKKGGFIDAEDI